MIPSLCRAEKNLKLINNYLINNLVAAVVKIYNLEKKTRDRMSKADVWYRTIWDSFSHLRLFSASLDCRFAVYRQFDSFCRVSAMRVIENETGSDAHYYRGYCKSHEWRNDRSWTSIRENDAARLRIGNHRTLKEAGWNFKTRSAAFGTWELRKVWVRDIDLK